MQNQHKIPRVYLRQFGYQTKNNQWKVSVLKRGEDFTRQKSIDSFASSVNIFDINSHDQRLHRMFEKLNGDLETEYNNILSDIESKGNLSDKSFAYLLQLVVNLIVRSDYWRNWVMGLLNHENRPGFIQTIVAHLTKDYEDFKDLKNKEYYTHLLNDKPEDVINKVLLFFTDHLFYRLAHFEVVILESEDDKPWCTSDNPTVMHNRTGPLEIFAKESEIYFPLSPKYLAYIHFKDSDDKANLLRGYDTGKVHKVTESQNREIQKIISNNPSEHLICAGEVRYKYEKPTE